MTDLERFDYGPLSASIRVVQQDGQPQFILTDLAKALGYRDSEKAKRLLRHSQYNTLSGGTWRDLRGRGSAPLIVTEGGLYRLALRSDRPEADPFQDWVTDEVLPALRTKGFYLAPGATEGQLLGAKREVQERIIRIQERKDYRNITARAKAAGAEGRDYADLQDYLYQRAIGMTARTVRARQPQVDGKRYVRGVKKGELIPTGIAKDHLTEVQLKRVDAVVMGVGALLELDHPDGTAPLGAIRKAIDKITS
jgi:prophage antirepressor-like protein